MEVLFVICAFPSLTEVWRSQQGKGRPRKLSYQSPSPPVSPRSPIAPEVTEESGDEDTIRDADVTDQQQVAMQQEERVLTEQIESLQKEK